MASPKDRDVERKFNPWHDPRDGKFTFAGAGRYAAGGSRASAPPVGRHVPKIEYAEDFSRAPVASLAEADAWRARELAKYRGDKDAATAIQARYQRYRQAFAPRSDEALQSVASRTADFARGVGDGVFDTAKGTATGLYALATTNPLTTARKVGRGIAEAIDGAIAAEDVPASIQIGRTANSIANASAYDIGHAVGAVGGNVGLTVGPGALAGRIAAARGVGAVEMVSPSTAQFGISTSSNYRGTFFGAYPGTKGSVVVHHAVEKEVLIKYPNLVSKSEMHSLENLRGIPQKIKSELHLRQIRLEWNRFYKDFVRRNVVPSKAELLAKATEIDRKYGHQFRPAR